jgi:hypothetical protein
MAKLYFTTFLLLITAAPTLATDYYVSCQAGSDDWDGTASVYNKAGNGPKATIQAAINTAQNGDKVIVGKGVYTDCGNHNINFKGKRIVLSSKYGPQDTIIDCQDISRGFYFKNAETNDSVVDGFTIVNGRAKRGGAIYCHDSSPTISNCVISDNIASSCGGAIYCQGSGGEICAPVISNNIITSNYAAGPGAGISVYYFNMRPILSNNLIAGNYSEDRGGGVAIFAVDVPVELTNNTIVGKKAEIGGGISLEATSDVNIKNCIIWDNTASDSPDIDLRSFGSMCPSTLDIDYCVIAEKIVANPDCNLVFGTGNIAGDPLFVQAGYWDTTSMSQKTDDLFWVDGDYHLLADSPVIDRGNNSSTAGIGTDIDGHHRIVNGMVDIGAYEVNIKPLTIEKAIIISSLTSSAGDSFLITGSFDQYIPSLDDIDNITIRLGTAAIADIYEHHIDPANPKLKIPPSSSSLTYSEKTSTGNHQIKLDLSRGTFLISAKQIDLTALQSPIQLAIVLGDYYGMGQADENIINDRKPIPPALMNGFADTLYLDDIKTVGTSSRIKGRITFENPDSFSNSSQIIIAWGCRQEIIPTSRLLKRASSEMYFYRPDKKDDTNISAAIFDLNRCYFTLITKNIAPPSTSDNFTITLN